MTIKLLMLIIFFSIMIGVGFYSRRHATNVNDFVLGGDVYKRQDRLFSQPLSISSSRLADTTSSAAGR